MIQVHVFRKYFVVLLLMAATALIASPGRVVSAEVSRSGPELLLETYRRNMSRLETNSTGIPLVVVSVEQDSRILVDVYGIFDHRFSDVTRALNAPENWCDIVALYPNVKACTYKEQFGVALLTFYLGHMVYQTPQASSLIKFKYRNNDLQQNYMDMVLTAAEGPYGTKDHRIRVESCPLTAERTFIHVSYSYSDSGALRFASKLYFSTFGRDKVGFTVIGKDSGGNPVYLGGPRGAVERNAVRCFFAIQSVMSSLHYPEERRFNLRTNTWYDLTTRFRKQLFDMSKTDYLAYKTKEHKNQITLQRLIVPDLK